MKRIAWAVMELPNEIQAFQFDYDRHKQYSIFPTRKDALIWKGKDMTRKIIKVRIESVIK